VEELLIKRKLKMVLDKKARLIVLVYDDCRAQHIPPNYYLMERALLLLD